MGDPFENFAMFNSDDNIPAPPQDDMVIDESQIPPQPEDMNNASAEQPVTATRIPKTQKSPVQAQPVAQQQTKPTKTDGSTEQNLAILMNIQDYYTDLEWTQKYTLYLQECKKIEIDPLNLTGSDIMIAAGRIDALLTPVRADYATMQRLQGHYDMLVKLNKESSYIDVVRDCEKNGKKYSIDDKKALATEKVQNDKSYEDNLSVFELQDRYEGRFIQIKTIIDILSDKKDLLITFSAALKIENTANNFTASVPTDKQVNQMRK